MAEVSKEVEFTVDSEETVAGEKRPNHNNFSYGISIEKSKIEHTMIFFERSSCVMISGVKYPAKGGKQESVEGASPDVCQGLAGLQEPSLTVDGVVVIGVFFGA